MAVKGQPVMDSIAVKMLNVAQDVFSGMTAKNINMKIGNVAGRNIIDNQSISHKVGDFLGGGIRASLKDYNAAKNAYNSKSTKNAASAFTAIKKGHMTNKRMKDGTIKQVLDTKKVAGTAVSLGLAGRVATGGGLYKDKYGNTNLPGIPFI